MNPYTDDWLTQYNARMAALRVPARQNSASPARDRAGHHAQAAPQGVNAEASAGVHVDGDACAPRRLSSRAIARLQPEQRLQIEVVTHWRPRLVPGARLLGINGELPGGGKLQALRAAIRRDMGYVKGCSDVLAVRPGHVLWLEGKVPPNDCSAEQAAFADWAHSIGHGYGVFTSIEDAGVLLGIHGMLA